MTDEIPRYVLREPEDDLFRLLRSAQRLILRYPVAAQAIFSSFVAEGRAYAKTAEGARWKAALAESELVRRGRVVWDVATLNVLEEDPETVVPSKIVDALVKAAAVPGLEPMLSRLFHLHVSPSVEGIE